MLACARGGLINFDRTRYSVPASFANRPVSLRIYPDRLVVVAEGHVICTHERIIDRSHRQPGRVIYDWRHYLAVVQRKPGALRNGAPFVEMPAPFRMLQAKILRQPPLTVCVQTVDGNGRGPRPSRACKHTLPGSEWSIFCHLSCTMMSKPCFAQWNWHWRQACRPKPMC